MKRRDVNLAMSRLRVRGPLRRSRRSRPELLIDRIRDSVIGDDIVLDGPFTTEPVASPNDVCEQGRQR